MKYRINKIKVKNDMEEKKLKIYINRKITPLILITEKNTNFSKREIINEIDDKCLIILGEIKENYSLSKSELLEIEEEVSYLLAKMAVFQIENNNNIFLDDFVDNIIEIINVNIEEFIKTENKEKNINLFMSIKSSIFEITNFHDILYFSDYINLNELQEINDKYIKNLLKINYEIIYYLKNNKNNDIEYIYSITNLIDEIYSNTIKNLFIAISNDDKKIKDYVNNYPKHIDNVLNLFIEKYTLIINLNDKYYKKLKNKAK